MTGKETGASRRVGLVVEGPTEYRALPELLRRLGVGFTAPSCFHGQPVEAPIPELVRHTLLGHIIVQIEKGANPVLVVIDLEDRTSTVGTFKRRLQQEVRRQVRGKVGASAARKVLVIVCNRKFENWLLADPKGITRCNLVRRDLSNKVRCHSDGKDAEEILKSGMQKGIWFRKAVHGPKIAAHVRVQREIGSFCSESFREFLKIVQGD